MPLQREAFQRARLLTLCGMLTLKRTEVRSSSFRRACLLFALFPNYRAVRKVCADMLYQIDVILGLLLAVAFLAWLALRISVPYPILLVLGGLVLALILVLPRMHLEPDLVFLFFL